MFKIIDNMVTLHEEMPDIPAFNSVRLRNGEQYQLLSEMHQAGIIADHSSAEQCLLAGGLDYSGVLVTWERRV
jgi:hypothetical protein|tara:strand:+ start:3468 stop:3686 length:219 start_codon:yes stop_codon:yes gene_type:complete